MGEYNLDEILLRIEALEKANEQVNEDFAAFDSDLTAAEIRIDTLESDASELELRIRDLELADT